ncbi:DUF2171 domain-containing protein [Pseudoroseomonas wenyumeiae]
MTDKSMIKEHAEIVGSCGTHVGTVDGLEGDFIKLTRGDRRTASTTTCQWPPSPISRTARSPPW